MTLQALLHYIWSFGVTGIAVGNATLLSNIEHDRFFEIPDDDVIQLIGHEFHDELERLKTAYSIPELTPKALHTVSSSPSMKLFNYNYDEINRTFVGIFALRWIHNRDFASFTRNQPEKVRLTRESFDWIHGVFRKSIRDSNNLYALITSMIINDLGKCTTLASDFKKLTNIDISHTNHDMVLYQVVDKHAELIPSLQRLRPDQKLDLLLGIELGAEFNFGQLAQAENLPASLACLERMRGHGRAFEQRFMEQLLDIAGASGHMDDTCARRLMEPVFQSYKSVYVICLSIIAGDTDVKDGYDAILTGRINALVSLGWTKGLELDVQKPQHRYLMRLFCICNVRDIETAELVADTVEGLDDTIRDLLILGLNVDGSIHKPAVQPTYIPAVCHTAMDNTKTDSRKDKRAALAAVFRYLAHTLTVSEEDCKALPYGVTVIERDVRKTAMHVVQSNEFNDDPNILDSVDMPGVEVANMAKGWSWSFVESRYPV